MRGRGSRRRACPHRESTRHHRSQVRIANAMRLNAIARSSQTHVHMCWRSSSPLLKELLLQDSQLSADISGFENTERSRSAVAPAGANGTAEMGQGTEHAAPDAASDFVLPTEERCCLVCRESTLGKPPIQRLPQRLESFEWPNRLSAAPRYPPVGAD